MWIVVRHLYRGVLAKVVDCELVHITQVAQHFLTDYHIEVSGNDAVCMSYMQARHFNEGHSTWDLAGYYTYNLVRTDDGWKIPKYTLTVTQEESRAPDFRF